MEKKKTPQEIQKSIQFWKEQLLLAKSEGNKRAMESAEKVIKRLESDLIKSKS